MKENVKEKVAGKSSKVKIAVLIASLLLIVVIVLIASVVGSGFNKGKNKEHPILWSWSNGTSDEKMKEYEDKYIELEGYFAPYGDEETSLYYISCIPQNQRMFEKSKEGEYSVIALSFNDDTEVEYYEGLVKVNGKVEFGTYGTDTMGYQYNYKLVDASYEVVNTEEISNEEALKYNKWLTEEDSDLSVLFDDIDSIGNTIYWKTQSNGSCVELPIAEYTELGDKLESGDEYDKRFSNVVREMVVLAEDVNKQIENEDLINEDIDSDKLLDIRIGVEALYMKYIYAFEVFNLSDNKITYDEFDVDKYFEEQIEAYEAQYEDANKMTEESAVEDEEVEDDGEEVEDSTQSTDESSNNKENKE